MDHAVPPDVPLRNYLYLIELFKELGKGGDPERCEAPGLLESQLGPIEEMWHRDMILGRDEEALRRIGHY